MKVLVVNCGSSSLKYQLFEMDDETVLAKGLVDRIGLAGAYFSHQPSGKDKVVKEGEISNHSIAIKMVIDALTDKVHGVITSMKEIAAVGHRVVHGAELFTDSVVITPEVIKGLETCIDFAPLHTTAHILGINACMAILPGVPQVAVFDTAFHQTMPKRAYIYGLPYEAYEKYGIRRYGAHGTSHRYVAHAAADFLGKSIESLKLITCHLGNGASISAVEYGKCIDTSMGLTPLGGIIMGTRSGDMDPAIIWHLMKKEGLQIEEVDEYLNKKSGVLGISGISSDFRDILAAAKDGNERAELALDIYSYRVRKFIGSYAAAMNGVDAIIFTAGMGENSVPIRKRICEGLQYLGTELDEERNVVYGELREISKAGSKVKLLVIPTNEELVIARDTKELCL